MSKSFYEKASTEGTAENIFCTAVAGIAFGVAGTADLLGKIWDMPGQALAEATDGEVDIRLFNRGK